MLNNDVVRLQLKKKKAPNEERDMKILQETFPFFPKEKLHNIYMKCAYSLMDTVYLIHQYHFKDRVEDEHIEWIFEKNRYIVRWCKKRVFLLLDKLESVWSTWFVKGGRFMNSEEIETTLQTISTSGELKLRNPCPSSRKNDYHGKLHEHGEHTQNYGSTPSVSDFLQEQGNNHLEEYLEIAEKLNESVVQMRIREQSEHFMEKWLVKVDEQMIRRSIQSCWKIRTPTATKTFVYETRRWIEECRVLLKQIKLMEPDEYNDKDELRVEVSYCKWMIFLGRRDWYVFNYLEKMHEWSTRARYNPAIASTLIFLGWFRCHNTKILLRRKRYHEVLEYESDEDTIYASDNNGCEIIEGDEEGLDSCNWKKQPALLDKAALILVEGIKQLYSGSSLSIDQHEHYLAYRILGDMHALHPEFSTIFNPTLAIGEYTKAFQIARDLQYTFEQLEIVEKIAYFYDHVSNSMNDAHTYYTYGIQLARELKDSLTEGILLKNMGTMYLELRQFKFAQDYLSQAEELIPDSNFEKAQCLLNRGRLLQYIGRMEEAGYYYNQARKIYSIFNVITEQIRMYHRIADTLVHRNKLSDAISQYMRAVDLSIQTGDVEAQIESFSRIASVYKLSNDTVKSVRCLERAQSISIEAIRVLEGVIPMRFLQSIHERCLQMMHIHFIHNSHIQALNQAEMMKKMNNFNYNRKRTPNFELNTHWLSKMKFPPNVNRMIYYVVFQEFVYIYVLKSSASTASHPYVPVVLHSERVNIGDYLGNGTTFEKVCKIIEGYTRWEVHNPDSLRLLSQLYQCLIQPISAYFPTNSSETVVFVPDPCMKFLPFNALYNMRRDLFLIELISMTIIPSIDTAFRLLNHDSTSKDANIHSETSQITKETTLLSLPKNIEFVGVKCPKYRRVQYNVDSKEQIFVSELNLHRDQFIILEGGKCNPQELNNLFRCYNPRIFHFSGRISLNKQQKNEYIEYSTNFHFQEVGIRDQLLEVHDVNFRSSSVAFACLPFCDSEALHHGIDVLLRNNFAKVIGSQWRCPSTKHHLEIMENFYSSLALKQDSTIAELLRTSILHFQRNNQSQRMIWNVWAALQHYGL